MLSVRHTVRLVRAAAAIAAFALFAAGVGGAEENASAKKPIVFKTQVINVPSAAGMPPGVVAQALRAEALRAGAGSRDLRNLSAEESREIARGLERAFRLNRSTEGLHARQVGNGLVSMNLDGRFLHIYVGRKEADGSISTACVSDWASAEAFLRGGEAPGSKPVKE